MAGAFVMRFTLALLGLELDITLGPATTDDEADPLRDLGATGCYPISFSGTYATVEEAPMPQRVPAWDDEE